mmetsp:Transcript_178856/g.567566  ORF Transcript_178856/g.567566 Transcript_178856/m.567566 type:complete len:280 (+) Transcript_178856:466-1305(+)
MPRMPSSLVSARSKTAVVSCPAAGPEAPVRRRCSSCSTVTHSCFKDESCSSSLALLIFNSATSSLEGSCRSDNSCSSDLRCKSESCSASRALLLLSSTSSNSGLSRRAASPSCSCSSTAADTDAVVWRNCSSCSTVTHSRFQAESCSANPAIPIFNSATSSLEEGCRSDSSCSSDLRCKSESCSASRALLLLSSTSSNSGLNRRAASPSRSCSSTAADPDALVRRNCSSCSTVTNSSFKDESCSANLALLLFHSATSSMEGSCRSDSSCSSNLRCMSAS